jgi:hypothetical protein
MRNLPLYPARLTSRVAKVNLLALMVQILRLSRIAGTAPLHFRVVLKDSHRRETLFGSEEEIRRALVEAGVSVIELDRLFKLPETGS